VGSAVQRGFAASPVRFYGPRRKSHAVSASNRKAVATLPSFAVCLLGFYGGRSKCSAVDLESESLTSIKL
jgi:hypothetical protein